MIQPTDAQRRADARYRQKRVQKTVSFNSETEADLLEYAGQVIDFSGWVKQKLAEEKSFKKKSFLCPESQACDS